MIPMMPPAFEYFAPTGIDEVVELLTKYEGEAKILAGGQSIIPLLKSRISSIPYLVSLSKVKGLSYIEEDDNGVRIGAMTVDSDIETSGFIKKEFPVLYDAMSVIADPLVRNVGTIGGNLAHADPANDLPAVMLALGATFRVHGPNGDREISVDDFFIDTFTTALEQNEILTEIFVPFGTGKTGSSYMKFKKGTWNFSVAGVAAQLSLEGKTCADARIAMTSVSPKSQRAVKAEEFLRGKELNETVIREAAKLVASESEPSDDSYGSTEYKKEILRRITVDALETALKRSGSE